MKTGVQLITEEREKQISKHGFTGEHHFNHPEWYDENQLIDASRRLSYKTANDSTPTNWDAEWFKNLCDRPYKERLVIAGALIGAEIDRLSYENDK